MESVASISTPFSRPCINIRTGLESVAFIGTFSPTCCMQNRAGMEIVAFISTPFPGPVYNNMAVNYQYIFFQVPDDMNRARLEGVAFSRFMYT